jgi:hypothetical protein
MNLYLISYGNPRDTRTYLADGGDHAIVIQAEDREDAIAIARSQLTVIAPATVEAHEVRVLHSADPRSSLRPVWS